MSGKLALTLLGTVASWMGLGRDTLSLCSTLKRCKKRGLKVQTVIDIGASDGRWSMAVRKFFPETYNLLIEAQEGHKSALEKARLQLGHFYYVIAAAGDRTGTVFFDAGDPFGGLASATPVGEKCITVPMVTVDDEVSRLNLPPPYLIKLDTHGFEVPILEGARKTLADAAMIVIECYNFKLTDTSLKFYEMCAFMEKIGFSCIDLAHPMHRPGDYSFWQMDLFFIPSDSVQFTSRRYHS